MASGYQTSDGKDLDSRYLGINAKAKSAATADTATTATKANALVKNRYSSNVAVVSVDITPEHYQSKSWSAPSDGTFLLLGGAPINTGHTATVLGVNYAVINDLNSSVLLLKKGDTITVRSADDNYCYLRGKFWPLAQR